MRAIGFSKVITRIYTQVTFKWSFWKSKILPKYEQEILLAKNERPNYGIS